MRSRHVPEAAIPVRLFSLAGYRIVFTHLSSPVHPALACLVVLLLALTGCASDRAMRFVEGSITGATLQPVFVATTRAKAETRAEADKGDFSGDRGQAVHYGRYQVSIPRDHVTGKIEWSHGRADPTRHFAVAAYEPTDRPAFKASLNEVLVGAGARDATGQKRVVLFVHGYNTKFSEALYRTAQMKHDFEMPMPMVLFSWPSAGDPGLYVYDRDSVKIARDPLVSVIRDLVASDATHITLVAHSLGSELLMEAIRQIALTSGGTLSRKIDGLMLIAPDLDIDLFNNQLAALNSLPPNFAIFVSRKDKALQLSSFLTGKDSRVGNNIDASKIHRGGIAVIDVSDFDGGDPYNHMTTVTSPELVAILKGMARTGQRDMLKTAGQQRDVSTLVVDTATLPLTLVIKTTNAILK